MPGACDFHRVNLTVLGLTTTYKYVKTAKVHVRHTRRADLWNGLWNESQYDVPAMIQAFYKVKPEQDTPYRQLSIVNDDRWEVRLSAGTKWGREHARELKVIPAATFDEAKQHFDKLFEELHADGWLPYT